MAEKRSSKSKKTKKVSAPKVPNPILIDICQAISDKKGFNIVVLDVREVSSMTDYFIIAEGNVDRHVAALAEHVYDVLQEKGYKPVHIEGLREGNWVVLDYIDFMVHFFIPELRQYYSLEEVWKQGQIVNVPVDYE
jgi:ribosome-associated protein